MLYIAVSDAPVDFGDLHVSAQVVGSRYKNRFDFKIFKIIRWNGRIAKYCADNISGYCPGRIAVTVMVDSADNTILEAVDMSHHGEHGYGYGLVTDPTFS